MSDESRTVGDRLRQGIEAARAGQHSAAREHLIAVLKQDRNNIPALLWLAFVADEARDSLRLLRYVLTLDPDNERAWAGVRWARRRLGRPAHEPDPAEEVDSEADLFDALFADDSVRKQFLTGEEIQKQAKKGILAHRARRTINPFLAIIIITGILGLVAIGLRGLIFLPPDSLAAWLPAPTRADIGSLAPQHTHPAPEIIRPGLEPTFAAAVDSLPDQIPQSIEWNQPVAPAPQPPTALASVAPYLLIGPKLQAAQPEEPSRVDTQILAHQPAYPGEKWIEVNVTTQQVTAWEGDVPVMSLVASTGLPSTPTVLGKFNIYWKLDATTMIGPDYYLPDVPYTMYFQGSYALHGTYWHNNFGQPMSHGCVNLSIEDAKRLFEWAEPVTPSGKKQVTAASDNPGTLVVVHE